MMLFYAGFTMGFIFTVAVATWLFRKEIEYKAETGTRLHMKGKLYSITEDKTDEN